MHLLHPPPQALAAGEEGLDFLAQRHVSHAQDFELCAQSCTSDGCTECAKFSFDMSLDALHESVAFANVRTARPFFLPSRKRLCLVRCIRAASDRDTSACFGERLRHFRLFFCLAAISMPATADQPTSAILRLKIVELGKRYLSSRRYFPLGTRAVELLLRVTQARTQVLRFRGAKYISRGARFLFVTYAFKNYSGRNTVWGTQKEFGGGTLPPNVPGGYGPGVTSCSEMHVWLCRFETCRSRRYFECRFALRSVANVT